MATPPEPPDEQPRDETPSSESDQPETSPSAAGEYNPQFIQGALFPHEVPSEHWDADFGDSRQVYQGSDLPLWLLAGWAVFIIWALVYLYFGLRKF